MPHLKDCRVVLAQTNPRLGDVHANLKDHLEELERAKDSGAELVLFPELSLTGYFLKDQVFELALERDAELLAQLAEASKHVSFLAGFVERSPGGQLYNAVGLFEDGRLAGVHRKVHLVSYGMFEEERDFAAGDSFEVLESRHGRFGPLICEDLWHMPGGYLHFLDHADALVVPSASPARGVEATGEGLASERTWLNLLTTHALLYRTWVLYVGRVGWEDGIGFGGGSLVVDPTGNVVARIDGREPGRLEAVIDAATLRRARVETPLRRDEKPWVLAGGLAAHLPPALPAQPARAED